MTQNKATKIWENSNAMISLHSLPEMMIKDQNSEVKRNIKGAKR